MKSILNYQFHSKLQIEIDYTRYEKDQKAVSYNYLEERKAMVSMPFHGRSFSALFRLTVDQILLKNSSSLNSEFLVSGSVYGISTNFTTNAFLSDPLHPFVYSTLSLGFRLPAKILCTPQVQYEYSRNGLISSKIQFEKFIFQHGILNLFYEHDFIRNSNSMQAGFRYDFKGVQTVFSGSYDNRKTILSESANGSLLFDHKSRYIGSSLYSSVGKGGIVIAPFLDLNCNGRRDDNEPRVNGLLVHMSGGRMEQNKRDSTIRILDLEPFTNYFIELDRFSFDNIAWQIQKPLISVAIDPNQLKLIQVPISIVGEVSGMVYMNNAEGNYGYGRILVSFFGNDGKWVARTQTESDGYFTFLGLAPGSYTARIDTLQLHKLRLIASPIAIPFTIKSMQDGDQVEGLSFNITSVTKDTMTLLAGKGEETDTLTREASLIEKPQKVPAILTDTGKGIPAPLKAPVVTSENKKITVDNSHPSKGQLITDTSAIHMVSAYSIQVGAFYNQANALAVWGNISSTYDHPVVIVFEDDYYKVRVTGFNKFREAGMFLRQLTGEGYDDAYIINTINK